MLPGRVEIIAVGSELLGPNFLDTNSLYLSARLNDLGWTVAFKTIVGDEEKALRLRLREALRGTELVVVMGGLGPTSDDVTAKAVARTVRRKLVLNKDVLKAIETRLRQRRIPLSAANRKQAYVVKGAEVIPNKNGTAPGQWLTVGGKQLILLPGPPHELKPMCEESVWPVLTKKRRGFLVRGILKTTGLAESVVETLISDLYPRRDDLNVTVLASPGQIEVHLTAFSAVSPLPAERRLRRLRSQLARRMRDYVFTQTEESLEEVVGRLLKKTSQTLAVAESCSGGLIGHRLTNVPGSSAYFLEGVIAYSNAAKIDLLFVSPKLIETHGAVSPQTAIAMARGVRKRARADFGLAVTGIAGPSGGTPDKPVGLVFVALAWRGGAEIQKNLFLGTRERIKIQSAQKALDILRRHLLLEVRTAEKRKKP
ncbi:MAG: competence/damage-inducible protein A [Candidatus Aminicenantales bacterium]